MKATKLCKADAKRLDEAQDQARQALHAYQEACEVFSEAVKASLESNEVDVNEESASPSIAKLVAEDVAGAAEPLAEAWSDVESAMEALVELCGELAETLQGEWDDRSEKWQESDQGSLASDWIDRFASFEEPRGLELPSVDDIVHHILSVGWGDIEDLYDHDWESTEQDIDGLSDNCEE